MHARTALLHAAHRWPQAVNAHLWPAALKHYTNMRNSIPTKYKKGERLNGKQQPDQYDESPLSRFSGTEVESNLDHFHPFGCPVYVLESSLQAQKSHNKWSDRSRVGIFLCHSPNHAKSVPLVLNTQTGNVSPQFHCIYDDEFATCKRDAKFKSLWQIKSKLVAQPMRNSMERIDVPSTLPTPPILPTAPVSPSEVELPASTDNDLMNSALPDHINHDFNSAEGSNSPPIEDSTNDEMPTLDEIERASEESSSGSHPEVPQYVSRSGRTIRPRNRLTLLAAFFVATTPSAVSAVQTPAELLQPDVEATP